jgi:hypothetical protein
MFFWPARVCAPSPGKEINHENETVCSAGGIAVLALGPGGHGGVVLHEIGEVLPGKLLRQELLREWRELLPWGLLQVTKNSREPEAGSWFSAT